MTVANLTPKPGVITVFADIWCSFAHIAVFRLHQTRAKLGLTDKISFDLRAFPLELLNDQPSPRSGTDSEVGRMGQHEPEAGWQLWQAKEYLYPSTTLPALEAVIATKEQGYRASEQLDLALRRAFWAESQCISNRKVIMDAARSTGVVDVKALAEALDDGRARKALSADAAISATDQVNCSPHLFLPDGTDHANPGIEVYWEGVYGVGWPVVSKDDPGVFENLLTGALA
ncbi:putative DsbA family dithiol-disulfide isomerase [Kibdelosporangium banguiense]|uniref:DsbA family dithiol-disulfide isomerase n=1 Tax=Kibdelosporangium banguiense TaxID=1365924 RepID=A0ABS4TWG9_9PSEU|nr:DsbA family protein [Kibdelosporangium banguiense]MBP2328754.1 putative DsbA family dithiol-disulfide isomerase [Kibdelosporangium banguiense]